MVDFHLTAKTPLGGVDRQYDGLSLSEVSGSALVSIAFPREERPNLADALARAFGAGLPSAGQSADGTGGMMQFLGLQADLVFVLFDEPAGDPAAAIGDALDHAGYTTDLSDAWAMLRINGPRVYALLERISPVDLHPDRAGEGAVVRTVAEHIDSIIYHEGGDSFLLMSPRSMAKSFLHTMEASIRNIL